MKGRQQDKKYCEGDCDHMTLWNFRLCFEPSGLPPLSKNLLLIGLVIFLLFSLMTMFVSCFNMGNVQGWGILDIAENAATLKSLLPSLSSTGHSMKAKCYLLFEASGGINIKRCRLWANLGCIFSSDHEFQIKCFNCHQWGPKYNPLVL